MILSEGFIVLDEILISAQKIVEGLVIHKERIAYNLKQYAPFAATELLLIAGVKEGADRQKMHEELRTLSMQGKLPKSFDVSHHVGDAPARARKLVREIAKVP